MATYFIGDIQGCFDEFTQLLDKISFSPLNDTLYLAGDLIGRGPKSLETLEFISNNPSAIKTVLGNHDLHFLSIANGIKSAKPSDRFEALLRSPNLNMYVDYLRQQPLLIELPQHKLIMTHAGFSPQLSLSQARKLAQNVSNLLSSDDYTQLLSAMYSGAHATWRSTDSELDQVIYAINSFTRMRYCKHDGELNFDQSCPPIEQNDPTLFPWFKLKTQLSKKYTVIFGHWASLMGHTNNSQLIGLDTGCLWGGCLTAWQLENRNFISVPAIK